jgi:hypothetical protein
MTQGLIASGYNFVNTKSYYSKGELIAEAVSCQDIEKKIIDCDVILIGEPVEKFCDNGPSPIRGIALNKYQRLFNELNIWHKVIHYEYHDSCELNNNMLNASLMFKRSLINPAVKLQKHYPQNVRHIDYCAMDEFFTFSSLDKTYDIGYFFNSIGWIGGHRRDNVRNHLLRRANEFPNSLICCATGIPTEERRWSICQGGETPFLSYLRMLGKTKIVFTANPDFCEGDNRLWEALASKVLLFRDIRTIMVDHFPEDNKHCIVFDASNEASIEEAINKAKYYLNNEHERLKIADAGHDLITKYHRPINRINYMLTEYKGNNGH